LRSKTSSVDVAEAYKRPAASVIRPSANATRLPIETTCQSCAANDLLRPPRVTATRCAGRTGPGSSQVAARGSPADVTDTLHRIEPSTVRREVEAAGFKFEGESTILANPSDPHTAGVFDRSIQGRTDQFILKFRRPRAS
jgi:hypothetical protein